MNTHRRHFLQAGAAIAWGAASVVGAWAASPWPSKPVRIIVPFAPGGGADSSARVLAEVMAPALGQAIVVENKPGAGSAIGVTAAAQSSDAHTLLMGSNSMVINQALNPAITYDVARDFDAVGMVSSQPLVLVVPSSSRINSLSDLVSAARAAPGQLTAGNSGNGTLAHLTAELFSLENTCSLTHVPYKGESALMPDLISGQVALGFLNLPSVVSHIKSGRLRALAVSAAQPVAELPDVATFRALKMPNLEVLGWATLLAPKGLAAADLARLEGLLTQALASDAVQKRFAALSVTPFPMARKAAADYLRAEFVRWQGVIKSRGIKADA